MHWLHFPPQILLLSFYMRQKPQVYHAKMPRNVSVSLMQVMKLSRANFLKFFCVLESVKIDMARSSFENPECFCKGKKRTICHANSFTMVP